MNASDAAKDHVRVSHRELMEAIADKHIRLVPETPHGATVIERLKVDTKEWKS